LTVALEAFSNGRVFKNIEFDLNGGCWLWSRRTRTGYGVVSLMGGVKKAFAHRLAWIEVNGEIPPGLFVLHKCDVKACINPDHLFLGTHQENMDDMARKGRRRSGRRAPRLSKRALEVIASNRNTATATLAATLGVSTATVIVRRRGIFGAYQKQLTENQVSVLGSFLDTPSTRAGGWLSPSEIGGFDGSLHAQTASALSNMGLLERGNRADPNSTRPSWIYRLSNSGRDYLAALPQQEGG
jgi:hypothetical protein